MQVTGREERSQTCEARFELGWRLQSLLVKTAQKSLGDGDGRSELTLIFRRVWLGCRKNLHNFWKEQCGLQEG